MLSGGAARGNGILDGAQYARVVVGMDPGKVRAVDRPRRLDGIEAEDPIQAFIMRGDARLQVDVPRPHAGCAEGIPKPVPGENNVLRRHGRLISLHR